MTMRLPWPGRAATPRVPAEPGPGFPVSHPLRVRTLANSTRNVERIGGSADRSGDRREAGMMSDARAALGCERGVAKLRCSFEPRSLGECDPNLLSTCVSSMIVCGARRPRRRRAECFSRRPWWAKRLLFTARACPCEARELESKELDGGTADEDFWQPRRRRNHFCRAIDCRGVDCRTSADRSERSRAAVLREGRQARPRQLRHSTCGRADAGSARASRARPRAEPEARASADVPAPDADGAGPGIAGEHATPADLRPLQRQGERRHDARAGGTVQAVCPGAAHLRAPHLRAR
jgi:hypothetical protein